MGQHRDRIGMLPAVDRVRILTGRLKNLKKGRGDFTAENRLHAMEEYARALEDAARDLKKSGRA